MVGIGASAGGLETLQTFFSNMPPDCPAAIVIIQHLSPHHKSIMSSLLEKHTSMKVHEIVDGTIVQPNCVYLNPPGKNVAIFNRALHLMDTTHIGPINMPIDFFFRSLAEDQGENAICIILSGTASDGSLGIKAIKGGGGMAMVQEPETAKYDGMPKSAIGTGLIDFILPVEQMPEMLLRYIKHPFLESAGRINFTETRTQHDLQKILALIRSATGHDFSHYKQNTIRRRIERRLAVHQINKVSDYVLYLRKNPMETKLLFKDLVIGVTSFFRDPEAYTVLEEKALPALLADKGIESSLRIWVAGCSTGEEAYSLAIVVAEAMEKANRMFNVQIFATDIDERALDTARSGIYPESIGADVSPKRLQEFFTKEGSVYKIKKSIRDMVVFSVQNVVKDPPFSRLDLVSCRNLMIYMDKVLQNKILPLFHYTLNPEGILLLGTSETIGDYTDFFRPLNSKWKIYKRKPGASDRAPDIPTTMYYRTTAAHEANQPHKTPAPKEFQALAERAILEKYAPSGVLINDKFEILHFVGNTEKYLTLPTGQPQYNILNMARDDLKHKLTTTIHQALRNQTSAAAANVPINSNGVASQVDITAKPLMDQGLLPGFMLVIFEEKTPPNVVKDQKGGSGRAKKTNRAAESLEQELKSTREYLQAIIEELETSNEELKSTNEELQSVNEELQSTNEEMETSKEELQSTNEELATVNAELQSNVEELSKAGDDMNNLMAATEIAALFLDNDLRIKRYTPATARIVNLILTDVGRPLADLNTSFAEVDLASLSRKVLGDLNTVEMEISSKDNHWYSLKIMPYRTTENVIGGVVMTFIDIHKIKQAEKVRRMAAAVEDANDAILVQDLTGCIRAWNKGAQHMYGWTEAEALSMNIDELIPQDKQPENTAMADKLKHGQPIKSFKTQRRTKDGRVLEVWLTATALMDERGQAIEIATTERDLSWLQPGEGGRRGKK